MTRKAVAQTFIAMSFYLTIAAHGQNTDLAKAFVNPPDAARPWVYWFPLDGNISSNGITLDLEAMQRVGIGGVLYMETEQGTPKGPAAFAGPLWRDLFKHICTEAHRLGLEVNMNNDAGWCGSGGPWITAELSMQKVVWTETNLVGPQSFRSVLPQPAALRDFYRDIAVFAFPTPEKKYVIPRRAAKTAETTQEVPLRASYRDLPADSVVPRNAIFNLTESCQKGRLEWEVPPGNWTILRMGHTTTGKDNHPAPVDGRGLECDKLSKEGAEAAFAGLMSKVIADSPALTGQGKTLVSTHIDSWEVGSQNWTPKFREEFQRLRKYDPLPLLPVMTGYVVDSLEISERFLWDVRMTINDLLLENYAGHFRDLARRNGIRLSIEAYGEPADDMAYAGRADEPMAEFWSWDKFGAAFSCTEMASAAHVYGKQILGAEAFTATDAEKWQGHPGNIKDLGDWAFCEGINRFVFHRYALQPWADVRPGVSMGPWGLHYERTQTWWEQSKAWHEYLARCQYLLQQGRFVADLCFLAPEMSPQQFRSPVKKGYDRPGYNFDGCPPELVLNHMKTRNGRVFLPGGANYRLLVLPQVETMTPQLLRKIKELVAKGANIVGAPPWKSPSLTGYPECDREVAAMANELWGTNEPAELTGHRYGKGYVFWGGEVKAKRSLAPEEDNPLGPAQWIWHREGNPAAAVPPGKRFFRRVVVLPPGRQIASARVSMTADNSFACRVNGTLAGSGQDFNRTYEMDVKPFLAPGTNVIAVEAVNAADYPNPAGLIGSLKVKYADGGMFELFTDRRWESSDQVQETVTAPAALPGSWEPAQELGNLGMAPWGDVQTGLGESDPTPDITIISKVLERMGVPPDFTYQSTTPDALRYTHRVIDNTHVYFVANKNAQTEEALCSFRIPGKRPELWWPETGRIERPGAYEASGEHTRLPIRFGPHESVFVVFRKGASVESGRIVSVERNGETLVDLDQGTLPKLDAVQLSRTGRNALTALVSKAGRYVLNSGGGRTQAFNVPSLPGPIEVGGPWEVRFAAGYGAPAQIQLPKLMSWSEHPDPGVKYFSGTAKYVTRFTLPQEFFAEGRRLRLDLGAVAVIADVNVNGRNLGTLWKAPFQVDATEACKPGENTLELQVANLWINRQIGDEQLPEDSDRNPNGTLKSWPQWLLEGKPSPAGRISFTSWRLWKKDDPLVASGLLGPVTLHSAQEVRVKP